MGGPGESGTTGTLPHRGSWSSPSAPPTTVAATAVSSVSGSAHPRDERGYTAVELLAMTTVLVGFITVVVGGGRFVDSNSQVDDAAYAAARAASLETNFEAGQMAGRKAAADALADRGGKACTQLTVSFAGTDFRTSGHVSVEVTCHANLSDVVGFGLPGAKDFTSTAVVPIEQYRRLP